MLSGPVGGGVASATSEDTSADVVGILGNSRRPELPLRDGCVPLPSSLDGDGCGGGRLPMPLSGVSLLAAVRRKLLLRG